MLFRSLNADVYIEIHLAVDVRVQEKEGSGAEARARVGDAACRLERLGLDRQRNIEPGARMRVQVRLDALCKMRGVDDDFPHAGGLESIKVPIE